MIRIVVAVLLIPFFSVSQSFAPEPGAVGSTAIFKDSNVFIFWADDAAVTRGPLNIQNVSLGNASSGSEADAFGIADGTSIVSLGDGGEAVVTFPFPIKDGAGPDFAIFENGFADHYMEFAFVEVSSDGVNFHRFESVSEIPIQSQLTNFSFSNCAYVDNLAGKYRSNYGTPFDLTEMTGITGLDVNNITHVKLVDVIGCIDPLFASHDSQGGIINDPYPTEFESGGFDLDAIGVINSSFASLIEKVDDVSFYPNPFTTELKVDVPIPSQVKLLDMMGRIVLSIDSDGLINLNTTNIRSGGYVLEITNEVFKSHQQLIKL